MGLLNEIVPRSRLLDRAYEWAARITENAPLAVAAILRRHVLEVVHADDAHVGAGRDGLDAVLGLASPERPDAWVRTR